MAILPSTNHKYHVRKYPFTNCTLANISTHVGHSPTKDVIGNTILIQIRLQHVSYK